MVAVFLANFPEAMSSSAIMYRQGDSLAKILCMWTSLFLGTGLIAFLTALVFPGHCHQVGASPTEGSPHDQRWRRKATRRRKDKTNSTTGESSTTQ